MLKIIRIKAKYHYLFIFVILFFLYLLSSPGNTPYNYFTLLAKAFLQGRYWLTQNPPWLSELIPAGDRFYVVYPAMPAVIAMPFVFLFGQNFPQQYLAHLLGAGITLYAIKITRQIKKDIKLTIFVALFTSLGNIVWFLSSVGSAWYLGQITACFFLMAAIYELLTKKRPLLIGIFLGAAYLSRLHTILSLPFFLYPLIKKGGERNLIKLIIGISPFLIFNCLYNFLRFSVIWDKGYLLIPKLLEEPWYRHGLFNPAYIPRHLKTIFLSLPIFTDKAPFIYPSWGGLAIWITTPVFVYSFFSPLKEKITKLAWLAVISISLLIFMHGTTGFAQFGYRFAADFYPFLFFLTIKGLARIKLKKIHWFLLFLSILTNTWGVIWINKFNWVGF